MVRDFQDQIPKCKPFKPLSFNSTMKFYMKLLTFSFLTHHKTLKLPKTILKIKHKVVGLHGGSSMQMKA